MTKFNYIPQLSVVKLKVILAQTVGEAGGKQTTQVGNLLASLGFRGPCFELSPVFCRCMAAVGVSWGNLCWRLGCELPALLPDGENPFPVPLPACPHVPDSPDSHRITASWQSSLQVFGFNR